MPTGYTAPIFDGEGITFKQYAKRCLRAFGVCMHMRDEAMEAPPDKSIPERSFYREQLEKAIADKVAFEALGYEMLRTEYEAARNDDEDGERRYSERCKETYRRARSMADQVTAWKAPTAQHEELKKFMLDQLQYELGEETYKPHPFPKFEKWCEDKKRDLGREVTHFGEKVEQERKLREEGNAYLRAFYESIGEWP